MKRIVRLLMWKPILSSETIEDNRFTLLPGNSENHDKRQSRTIARLAPPESC